MESYIVANSAKFVKKTEKKTSNYKALVNESMWMSNVTTEKIRRNYFCFGRTQLDINNNNVDVNPSIYQDTPNIKRRKGQAESNFASSFHSNSVQIVTSNSYSTLSNNVIEQTEPIDLSCAKKTNSKAGKKKYYQAKSKNIYKCNSEVSIISESNSLIMQNVYGINHRRKPKCDEIFRRDPANPDLNICKLCAKRVRSKWHHFQTHYSRNHRCSECHAVYSRIDTLRSHAKKRHCTVIPRYYFGIPANVWHRVIVQCPGSEPRPVLGYNPIIRQQI